MTVEKIGSLAERCLSIAVPANTPFIASDLGSGDEEKLVSTLDRLAEDGRLSSCNVQSTRVYLFTKLDKPNERIASKPSLVRNDPSSLATRLNLKKRSLSTSSLVSKKRRVSEVEVERASLKDKLRTLAAVQKYMDKDNVQQLEDDIDKWRQAAQNAARDLYPHYQEAVIQQQQIQNDQDQVQNPFKYHPEGNELLDDQKSEVDDDDEEQTEERGLTSLQTMLLQFGIDPHLLRYDPENEDFEQ